jgi:hypothetical protein
MNSTFNATPAMRGAANTTACVVQIIGWCGFSEGQQTGIVLGFIALGLVVCCCYCAAVQQDRPNIYK